MLSLIRKLLHVPSPVVTKDQVLLISERFCRDHSWDLVNPRVIEGLRTWLVWINRDSTSSPWLRIDNQTGEVTTARVPPR
jgi:hypothetical protein